MSAHTQRTTAEQLLRMPRGRGRRELVEGELREMNPAGHNHGWIVMLISGPLWHFVREHDLGRVYTAETGFLLSRDPDTVRAPDVAFVTRERVARAGKAWGYFPGPPDLAVEVISPGDSRAEVEAKGAQWLAAGCRVVVLANAESRSLKVFRAPTEVTVLTVEQSFTAEDLLPGFELPVAEIFAE